MINIWNKWDLFCKNRENGERKRICFNSTWNNNTFERNFSIFTRNPTSSTSIVQQKSSWKKFEQNETRLLFILVVYWVNRRFYFKPIPSAQREHIPFHFISFHWFHFYIISFSCSSSNVISFGEAVYEGLFTVRYAYQNNRSCEWPRMREPIPLLHKFTTKILKSIRWKKLLLSYNNNKLELATPYDYKSKFVQQKHFSISKNWRCTATVLYCYSIIISNSSNYITQHMYDTWSLNRLPLKGERIK